jgi:enediyne biosynthesis protein E4
MLRLGLSAVVLGLVVACSKDSGTSGSLASGTAASVAGAGAPKQLLLSRPLAARAATEGKRFVRLDPATTGLSFRNELRRENMVAYVYMGAGLTVADYDNDGLPDIYLVSQDGQNKLFRQVAPMRFQDVTATAGAGLGGGEAWGSAATFADVDGDQDLDLYVCNLESPNLLFLNQGDGTFVESAGVFGLGLTAASTGAAFADYDNDGDLDLYVLTNRVFHADLANEILAETTLPARIKKTREQLRAKEMTFEYRGEFYIAGQRDRLFRNDGYAKFVDVTEEAGLNDHGNGLSVVWWDFDNDGDQDIYVANDFHSPDQLYENQGNGTFVEVSKQRLPHTAFFGMGSDFADINNDGLMDLCVADMSSTTHYMGKMLMGGMDDNRWFLMNAEPRQYMRNALYVNTGTERFREAAYMAGLSSTDWTWSVLFADLDEDGRQDLFASNGVPVFADNPDIGGQVERLWSERRYDDALHILRNLPGVDEKNIARRNLGNLQFADVGEEWGLDENGVTHGAVMVDLDGDGDLDLVTNNLNADASVFENRTSSSHRISVQLHAADGNHFGIGASVSLLAGGLRQLQQVSLARGYMSAGESRLHFGVGDATIIEEISVCWPSGRLQVLGKLAVDTAYEIYEDESLSRSAESTELPEPLFRETALPFVHQERDFDDFAVQPLLPHRLSQLGPGIACGDIDGDGDDDIWCGGAAGQPGSLLRNDKGVFVEVAGPWQKDEACEDLGALFLDFDRDGDLDLLVGSGGVEAGDQPALLHDRLYRNDGKATFTRAAADVLPARATSTSVVAAADFDRDGDLDVLIGCRVRPGQFPHADQSVLWRNDGGKFVDASASIPGLATVGMVTGACWTDLDGDGFVDLAVTAQWQPIRLFYNDAGRGFTERTKEMQLDGIRGQWNGLAAGDLDGDGDIDLVATNLGLNTKYRASSQKPMELFASDFDGNGTLDVIEAKRSGAKVLPVRGLSCSSGAMPFVREKFATYDSFARATLGDIYGDALQECLSLSCTELQHLLLENDNGRFVVHALPRVAQLSMGFGVVIDDFDSDGQQDIFLAHNFFSPEPETGRFDGGLSTCLFGLGGLRFAERENTGISLPGDSKAVATTDLDGDGGIDVVVTTNDGQLRSLTPRCRAQLQVRLVGPAGNPAAIGARITLLRAGQATVRELNAGGSYLAQSAPIARFAGAQVGDKLQVRWPDGKQTEHVLQQRDGTLVLTR